MYFPLDNNWKDVLVEISRCRLGLIGNPVQIGSGPAAVAPPFFNRKREPDQPWMPLFRYNEMGRSLNGRGSQKTCLASI